MPEDKKAKTKPEEKKKKERLEREYGLIYIDKEGKHFLYKSYFTLDDIQKTLEHDKKFNDIEKTGINIVHVIDGITYLVELEEVTGG